MKRKITHYVLLSLTLVTLPVVFMIFSGEKSSVNIQEDAITSLREQHKDFLTKSPFTETLKMTRSERKAQGLPPNKYFEQLYELSINPATGRTEPEKIHETQEKLKRGLSKRAPGDDASNPWIERGPNDIGGRTRAIMFDPNDTSNRRVYAGGVSGGLWVNNDITSAASQWSRVQNVPGNLSVTSITVDPRNSNIWYVGTGEQYTAGDVVGSGIYRSTDGGLSWQAINIPAAGPATFEFSATNLFLSGIFFVNDITAWNNVSQSRTELFVGVGAHVYGDSASPTNRLGYQTAGLYRSIDGGITWSRVESANLRFTFSGADYYFIPNDLEVASDNSLWMGTIETPGLSNGGGRVFSSVDGATWTEAAASPLADSNRVEIETSATDANKLYALTQGSGTTPVHIYRTTDKFGSATATALPNDADISISANDFTRGQAFYDLMIEADPTNDAIVYVGGIDLFRSSNSGNSWGQISKWSNNPGLSSLPVSLVHADQHAMTFRPGNSNQAIFGNDGGVFYASSLSTAQSSNVFGARNSNYNVTQYVKAGIGPDGAGDTSGIFTAGAQDNGSQAFRNTVPGINGSEELSDGDGFYTFVDKDGQYMTATFIRNVIYRFNLPWNGLGRRQGGATTLVNDQTTGDFVNQMGYDSDANFLLTNASAGTNFAIKTINIAANSNANITNALLTSKPTALTPSPFENNTWYIGTATGQILRLTNVGVGSANWTEITTPFVGSVSSVRLGETANDIMVTMHNYGVTSVWFSSNAGANWVSKEGDLPDIPVRDILQNPLDRNEVIVGTQLGVWVTTNFNAANPTWSQSQNGMSDASVTSFDYWAINGDDNNNKIIASTYGRGVFTGSFTASSTPDTTAPTAPTNLTATNTTQTTTDLSWTAATDNVGVTAYDVYQDGVVVASVTGTTYNVIGLTANTLYTFTVRAKDAAGNESADSNAATVTTSAASDTTAPTTPTNLTAANTTQTTTDLSWTAATDNVGVTAYDVYQDGVVVASVTGTTYNVTSLTANTSYTFAVRAKDAAGNESTDSNAATVTTSAASDITAPTAPTNLTATNTTQTTTDLSWTAATDNMGVTAYDVYQDGVVVASVTGTTYTVTGLTASTAYTFVVRAKDAAGNESADSNTANVTTAGTSGGTGCSGGITAFPYNQGFESGFGDWTQGSGDDFDWTRQSGGTPSNNTGPSSADQGTFYVYVETSNPNNPNRTTILNSPCFDLSGETSADYSFRYHMTGNAVGELKLEASSDNGTIWTQVWSRSGNQGTAWNTAAVNLDSYAGGSMQLRYVGTSGVSWQGDMAVDRISLSTSGSTGGGTGCTAGITSFPYNQGFEGGFGNWTQGSGDDFDWIRQSGGTPSRNTGPSSADQGTFYVYVETSTPNNPNRTTILNSPCFDLSSASSADFSFRYHMTGNAVGELKLEASNDDGVTWTEVWSRSGNQGTAWNTATVNLNSYAGNSMQLRYVGTSGASWQGDMAVDAIALSTTNTTSVTSQVEDALNVQEESFKITFYPNPVNGNLLYLDTSMKSTINYSIMNVAGQLVDKGLVSNNSINVQHLSEGVYIIKVSTENSREIISQFIKR